MDYGKKGKRFVMCLARAVMKNARRLQWKTSGVNTMSLNQCRKANFKTLKGSFTEFFGTVSFSDKTGIGISFLNSTPFSSNENFSPPPPPRESELFSDWLNSLAHEFHHYTVFFVAYPLWCVCVLCCVVLCCVVLFDARSRNCGAPLVH